MTIFTYSSICTFER